MKIKITCTKAEKEQLMKILLEGNCLFVKTPSVVCGRFICEECIEKNIEWEVTDDGCGKG